MLKISWWNTRKKCCSWSRGTGSETQLWAWELTLRFTALVYGGGHPVIGYLWFFRSWRSPQVLIKKVWWLQEPGNTADHTEEWGKLSCCCTQKAGFELNHLTLLPWTLLIRYPSLWATPNYHGFQVWQFHSLSAFLFPHEPAHTHHCAIRQNKQCVTNSPLPDGPPSCGTGSMNSAASPSISWANSANWVHVSEIQGKACH